MINLKKIFSIALLTSYITSLNINCDVSCVTPTSLTINSGVHLLYNINTKSKMWGIGQGLNLYVSIADTFGIYATGQITSMSNSNFDIGTSYNTTVGKLDKEMQGGMKNTIISRKISMGKETIFSHEYDDQIIYEEVASSYTRLYAGLGIDLEIDEFKSKDGVIGKLGVSMFAIDKYDSYSVIPGIDLKLFYVTNKIIISPEIFVGPSVHGRGIYTILYKIGRPNNTVSLGSKVTKEVTGIQKHVENPGYLIEKIREAIKGSSEIDPGGDAKKIVEDMWKEFNNAKEAVKSDDSKEVLQGVHKVFLNFELIKKSIGVLQGKKFANYISKVKSAIQVLGQPTVYVKRDIKDVLIPIEVSQNYIRTARNFIVDARDKIVNESAPTHSHTGIVKTLQSIGVTLHASIPVVFKISNSSSAGIRLNFKWNWRKERIETPINAHPAVADATSDAIGLFGEAKDTKIEEPLIKNIEGSLAIQFTYINM